MKCLYVFYRGFDTECQPVFLLKECIRCKNVRMKCQNGKNGISHMQKNISCAETNLLHQTARILFQSYCGLVYFFIYYKKKNLMYLFF